MNKEKTQESQYNFPYHYIPYIENNRVVRYRHLSWGFKYFCYLLHIRGIIKSLKPKTILDVGCGDGKLISLLTFPFIERKIGVDLSEKAISFANLLNEDSNFYAMDANDLNETFDVVIAMEVLEHIPQNNINYFLKTLDKRTKNNGYVILSVPTTVVPLNKKHYRHYNYNLLNKQINDANLNLKIIKIDYIYKEPFWLKLYYKFTNNKFSTIQIRFIENLIWKYIWNKLRVTNKKKGHNIIVTLKKTKN